MREEREQGFEMRREECRVRRCEIDNGVDKWWQMVGWKRRERLQIHYVSASHISARIEPTSSMRTISLPARDLVSASAALR